MYARFLHGVLTAVPYRLNFRAHLISYTVFNLHADVCTEQIPWLCRCGGGWKELVKLYWRGMQRGHILAWYVLSRSIENAKERHEQLRKDPGYRGNKAFLIKRTALD